MLAAVTRNIPVHEYSPREVKKGIVGKGNASKEQVQYMVKNLLRLKEVPKYYDVTDALAVSICHLHRRTSSNKQSFKSWKAFLTAHPKKFHSSGKSRNDFQYSKEISSIRHQPKSLLMSMASAMR